jgi:hypothetical protein
MMVNIIMLKIIGLLVRQNPRRPHGENPHGPKVKKEVERSAGGAAAAVLKRAKKYVIANQRERERGVNAEDQPAV